MTQGKTKAVKVWRLTEVGKNLIEIIKDIFWKMEEGEK